MDSYNFQFPGIDGVDPIVKVSWDGGEYDTVSATAGESTSAGRRDYSSALSIEGSKAEIRVLFAGYDEQGYALDLTGATRSDLQAAQSAIIGALPPAPDNASIMSIAERIAAASEIVVASPVSADGDTLKLIIGAAYKAVDGHAIDITPQVSLPVDLRSLALEVGDMQYDCQLLESGQIRIEFTQEETAHWQAGVYPYCIKAIYSSENPWYPVVHGRMNFQMPR